jgi:predicted alpha-1,2-mannosidase
MRKTTLTLIIVLTYCAGFAQNELTSWVNPFIGTGGHGHTYPGATVPFGLVQLSPDTRIDGWDGCGGYHYSDNLLYGFSHTHLQGTGVSDYGDILFTPSNGHTKKQPHWLDAAAQKFDHASEKASPGFYSVVLPDNQIQVSLTATPHCGIHQYQFAKGDTALLFINMAYRDELLYYDLQTIGDTVVYGYRVSKGWAEKQSIFFYAVFSHPIVGLDQLSEMSHTETNGQRQDIIEMIQTFRLSFGQVENLTIRVGLSGTDVEGAKKNLYAEAPHFNFDRYRQQAQDTWNTVLQKAPYPDGAPKDKNAITNYYSALYHCYTTPNIWSDVDGRYMGEDLKIHTAKDFKRYTIFSLWDTFRALHPLMTQLEPEVTLNFIKTFLTIYQERKELPVWELAANETYCMIGYHSVPVILEAYVNGITQFDTELALKAMIDASNGPEPEKKRYVQSGYVPADEFSESVSKTLEYAYDDACIAEFERLLHGKNTVIYKEYIRRAQNWKNVFDPETHFMRSRRNGGFIAPFDPYQVDFNYTEANAYQYSLFVPQDFKTLVEWHGGENGFYDFLHNLFNAKNQTTGREQADITGLIGQYAHGNEPSHHFAYLHVLAGETGQKEGKKIIEKIIQELYQNSPDGLCGNEDCGQMSAWLVCAVNGIYKCAPGLEKNWLSFSKNKVTRKGSLHSTPIQLSTSTIIEEELIVPVPIITGPSISFVDSAVITIQCATPVQRIKVSLIEEGKPIQTFNYYQPFTIYNACKIICVAFGDNDKKSQNSVAIYNKRDANKSIVSIGDYDNQYTGGGREALIDGAKGGKDFRTGGWQGYYGKNLEVAIDLGKPTIIQQISIGVLQDIKSWIWYPKLVEAFGQNANGDWVKLGQVECTDQIQVYGNMTKELSIDLFQFKAIPYQKIKLVGHSAFETIPDWHLGKGGKVWIFADEITVK